MTNLVNELRRRRIWRVLIACPSLTFALLRAIEFFINRHGPDGRFSTAKPIVAVVLAPAAFLWNRGHGLTISATRRRLFAFALFSITTICLAHAAELRMHTVRADGHPIALWEKSAEDAEEAILLVHGLTWSAIPDFDLQVDGQDLSLMDGLVDEGYAVYAVDLRGYGETPRDATGWLTPDRTVKDLEAVLDWIREQKEWRTNPHLFGWSLGSTRSQLLAQRHPELISSLILFGYPFDDDQVFPPDEIGIEPKKLGNTAQNAASDFITPGSISQKAIDAYVALALKSDPIKVDLKNWDHYNELDPRKVVTPTLILQSEHDPIAKTEYQQKLYTRLNTAHKQWITIPGGDHAAFMETPRGYFIHVVVSFLQTAPDKP
jgi:pimeloyl-ACP methyl ester carboxylesterase